MHEKRVSIPSISCQHCVRNIKRELGEVDGIESVEVDTVTKTAVIRWRTPITWELIRQKLEDAGYPPAE